jgi:hypothetical protein
VERGIRLLNYVQNHPATQNETKTKHITAELEAHRQPYSGEAESDSTMDYEAWTTTVLGELTGTDQG